MLDGEVIQLHGVLPVETASPVHHPDVPAPNVTIAPDASVDTILQIISHHQPTHVAPLKPGGGMVKPALQEVFDNGGDYGDYSPEYGYWDSDGGIDWGGSNANSDGPAPAANDAPQSTLLYTSIAKSDGSGQTVSVDFNGTTSDGKNGDQPVTQRLNNVTHDILAAAPGIESVNVSATTNGVHDTHSDHYSGNAIDINRINDVAVSSAAGRNLALQLEAQALADPNTRYVEGPGGNWVRTSAGGQWMQSADLPTMNNHVHWSTFRH